MDYYRKILLKNKLQVLDTDGDGVGDSLVLLPKEPTYLHILLTESVDNMGTFTEYEEVEEIIDLNGIWDTTNDGSGDGGTIPTNPGVTTNYGGGTTTDTDGSTETLGCTDPLASNYEPNATTDDGSCEYDFGTVGGTLIGGDEFVTTFTQQTNPPELMDSTNTSGVERYPSLVFNVTIFINGTLVQPGQAIRYITSYSTGGGELYNIGRVSLNGSSLETITGVKREDINKLLASATNTNLTSVAVWWLYRDKRVATYLPYNLWVQASGSKGGANNLIHPLTPLGGRIRYAADFTCSGIFGGNEKDVKAVVVNTCSDVGGGEGISSNTKCQGCGGSSTTFGDAGDIIPNCFLSNFGVAGDLPKIKTGDILPCDASHPRLDDYRPCGSPDDTNCYENYQYDTKRENCIGFKKTPIGGGTNITIPIEVPTVFRSIVNPNQQGLGCFKPDDYDVLDVNTNVKGWTKCGVSSTISGIGTNPTPNYNNEDNTDLLLPKWVNYNTLNKVFGGIRFSDNYWWSTLNANDRLISNGPDDELWAYKVSFMCSVVRPSDR